ncbi:kinase-like protein, partial [Saccharata proteae CBS 121410]
IEGIEPLHHYRPEGFHPAYIGEEFCDGRYRIVHKLGYGTTSTVWLAADNAEGKWVALKILMAFASKDSRESEALHALQAGNPKHMGRTFVTTFLDEFFIDGPNGRHRCLVSEPACPSIEVAVHEAYLGVNKARSIAAQALLALSYIHSCGVVHGDLHTGNILYHDPKSAGGGIAIDKLYERVGEPELVPVLENGEQPVVKSLPRFWVHDTCFCGFEGVKLLQVQIHDFGASSLVGNQNTRSLAPMVLRPPEVMFDEEITQASDMWTFGCTMYEILGRWCLFEGEGMFQLRDTDNDDILVQMVECFGKLPERWMERWEEKDNWFLPNGEWRTGKMTKHRKYLPKPFRTFSERFAEMLDRYNRDEGVIEAEEAACLEKLLRAMFALEPAERITAEEAVNSEWMQRWGLPA